MSAKARAVGDDAGKVSLPTRQNNALRILLNKHVFSPQEIAALDVRVIERAPGVGKKGLQLIDAWLKSQGYELSGRAQKSLSRSQLLERRKIKQAIDLLRSAGYEIHRLP